MDIWLWFMMFHCVLNIFVDGAAKELITVVMGRRYSSKSGGEMNQLRLEDENSLLAASPGKLNWLISWFMLLYGMRKRR